jgi:hypothetical protein
MGGDGFATLAQLRLDLPSTLSASTPRNGKHLFFRPLGVRSRKLGDDLEWIALGKFVVVPPALGREWLNAEGIAEVPRDLIAVVKKARDSTHMVVGEEMPRVPLSNNILSSIDVSAWRDHDEWLRLMMSAKIAGVPREEFISWSVSDPPYANDAEIIRRRWDGYEPDGRVTEATLFWALKRKVPVAPLPNPPKGRRKMTGRDRARISAIADVVVGAKNVGDAEGKLYWAGLRYGGVRMEVVITDEVLMGLLVGAGWRWGLRNKERMRRQIRNGLRDGALLWLQQHGVVEESAAGTSLSATVKPNEGGTND